jgi:uridine monophosphate synthetase
MTPETKSLVLELFKIEAIKFGTFTLKSGMQSPIYIDLRMVISYPSLMKKLSVEANKIAKTLSFDRICGVPYAALPLATALSLEGNYPMIFCRKEVKEYGTKKRIEGKYAPKESCLLVEDVMTLGTSILETATLLRDEGLEVNDAIVMLDREQGGMDRLRQGGIQLHPVISIFDLLKALFYEKKISEETFREVNDFLGNGRKHPG